MASIHFFCYELGDVSQTWRILIFGDYIFHSHAKSNVDAGQRDLTLFSVAFFFFCSWARGGRRDTKCPHLRNSESIRAMTTRLRGYIVWGLCSSHLQWPRHHKSLRHQPPRYQNLILPPCEGDWWRVDLEKIGRRQGEKRCPEYELIVCSKELIRVDGSHLAKETILLSRSRVERFWLRTSQ